MPVGQTECPSKRNKLASELNAFDQTLKFFFAYDHDRDYNRAFNYQFHLHFVLVVYKMALDHRLNYSFTKKNDKGLIRGRNRQLIGATSG